MSWLNTFERGYGWTFIDPAGGVGQIYFMTARTSTSRLQDLATSFELVTVDNPIARIRRLQTDFEFDKVPAVSDVNGSVKNVWRVLATNADTGLTEVITIPCADVTLLAAGTDLANLAVEPWLTLVSRLEGSWRFPGGGAPSGPMTVHAIRYEGDNL